MTGASGFIATHVCKLAAEQTHSVRGTVRSLHNACKIEPLRAAVPQIELFEADLLSDEGWSEAMQGCEYVFHVASPFPLHAPADENDLLRPAVEGTLRVLRAAVAEASVKRVIVTSSVVAISAGHAATATLPASPSAGKRWSEEDWSRSEGCEPYPKSKTLAEQAAWNFIIEQQPPGRNLELVTINPSFVLGPTLTKVEGSSTSVIARILRADMPMVPHIQLNCVDVRDVARAHILAMEKPVAGQRFLLNGFDVWLPEISRVLKDRFEKDGYSPSTLIAPYWLLWLVSFFDKTVGVAVSALEGRSEHSSSKRFQ